MTKAVVMLLLGLLVATCSWITAQDTTKKFGRPLDLPSGGLGSDEDEVEDAPELITYYGNDFEGDGFFWVLDMSGSMGAEFAFEILKQETSAAIRQLSPNSDFGVVFFSSYILVWENLPKPANSINKMSAITFVETRLPGGGTCLENGAVAMLKVANLSRKKHRTMLVLCDGRPNCSGFDSSSEALAGITAANYQRIPINCLYIAADPTGVDFMQDLAAANGGQFILISDGE